MTYRILNILLWPLWFFYTLRVAWREKNLRYFSQRLGYDFPVQSTAPVWVHCASVGEVNTWLPLHQQFAQQYPGLHFVITTNTVTGAQIVAKQALRNTRHVFLPMDTVMAVSRFFHRIRPRLALIMETELWPELYRQCQQQNVPLVIINARLSHKTRNANDWVKQMYSMALHQVSQVLCRTREDADAYIGLGADAGKVKVVGNLKFSAVNNQRQESPVNFTGRPYILAASTHADEEWQLAKLWQTLDTQNRLLVIAPRHPLRRDAILRQLQPLNLRVAVRSRGDAILPETQIYLADTLGELVSFMMQADVVLMGGSLVPRGGQNLLEPARLGRAIIVGPHMFNFAAETELFLQHRACLQARNTDELAEVLQTCLTDAGRRIELGRRAQQLMQEQRDMAERYLKLIGESYADVLSA
ncbi:MAG: 3-deoxy-D-manno-octulosonic-acid transferase [Pseudomonadota bacterium]|nr:3-deoxy-D-manno-octulosonic-acid transferase [Pseudomonadota bacterium]